jgi:hypothetical protein
MKTVEIDGKAYELVESNDDKDHCNRCVGRDSELCVELGMCENGYFILKKSDKEKILEFLDDLISKNDENDDYERHYLNAYTDVKEFTNQLK